MRKAQSEFCRKLLGATGSIRRSTNLFLVLAIFVFASQLKTASADGSCPSSTSYTCPNCGGYEVSDCFECDGFVSSDDDYKICFNRKLFQEHNDDKEDHEDFYIYLWYDLVGALVWFVTAGVSMACGVGGGGVYVPLGILLFQFAPKQASGLSQASIFGASLGGLLLNARDRHPNKKIRSDPIQQKLTVEEEEAYLQSGGTFYTRPLVHYDMALFMSPLAMAGAVLGVLIQKLLPNWLYLLIASLVLAFTSYKTFKKFLQARAKEKKAEAMAKESEKELQASAAEKEEELPDMEVEDGSGAQFTNTNDSSSNCDEEASEANDKDDASGPSGAEQDETLELRKKYLEDDMRQYPKEKISALVILWIGLMLLTFMKGGKGVESLLGIDCESPWYIVLIVLQFVWLFSFSVWFGLKLVKQQALRQEVQYPFLEDDTAWDFKSLRFYGSFTFIAGVVGGLIGVGGGMVLGPLMLIMGVPPQVSSATNATMVVLTSSSVAVMFVTSGLIHWTYACFYFVVCFFGAFIGKYKIDAYVKKTGRASILICILALIIAIATIGCLVIMLTRLAEKDWCFDGFNEFCKVDDNSGACSVRRLMEIATTAL